MNRDEKPTSHFYCVPCPTCRAEIGESCQTTGQNWVLPHSERVQRVRRIDQYKED